MSYKERDGVDMSPFFDTDEMQTFMDFAAGPMAHALMGEAVHFDDGSPFITGLVYMAAACVADPAIARSVMELGNTESMSREDIDGSRQEAADNIRRALMLARDPKVVAELHGQDSVKSIIEQAAKVARERADERGDKVANVFIPDDDKEPN